MDSGRGDVLHSNNKMSEAKWREETHQNAGTVEIFQRVSLSGFSASCERMRAARIDSGTASRSGSK
jgi:hypothetical protein